MKKFMLLHYGFVTPTPEIGKAWGAWFESIADYIVDGGNPFSVGREITNDGTTTELPLAIDSITGYTIINAEDLDAASKIAETCPSITGIRIYEMAGM